MASYEISPEAFSDLQGIWDFIAADNPRAADEIVDEIFDAFEHLATWPLSGHLRADLTPRRVRFWPARSYLIVYRERPEGIQIVAILHASRDLPTILKSR